MSVQSLLADRLPERVKPAARSLAHLLAPWMSWRDHRTVGATRAAFVARFFDSEAEFEAYEAEFFGGRIVDICRAASEQVPDDESIYDAHMDECVRLYALVRKYRPQTIVETGVYNGVSTVSVLLALAENGAGHLHSLDASPLLADVHDGSTGDGHGVTADRLRHYERGRPSCAERGTHLLPGDREPGWIVPTDLRDRWTLRVGRSQCELPELLDDVGPVDVFVHDSEHAASAMLFEFEAAWEHLVPGGLVVSCHVDHNDALETFAAERDCESGQLTFTYNGFEDYESPCSAGYLLKPPGELFAGRDDEPVDSPADHQGGEPRTTGEAP